MLKQAELLSHAPPLFTDRDVGTTRLPGVGLIPVPLRLRNPPPRPALHAAVGSQARVGEDRRGKNMPATDLGFDWPLAATGHLAPRTAPDTSAGSDSSATVT